MVDKAKWKQLFQKAKTVHQQTGMYPAVTLEEFFEGNDDVGSIGCNLWQHPGIDTFYRTLKDIRARDDVQDVRVGITDLNEYETVAQTEEIADWPFSDTVYIVSEASAETLASLLSPLQPDEVYPREAPFPHSGLPDPDDGYDMFLVWWD